MKKLDSHTKRIMAVVLTLAAISAIVIATVAGLAIRQSYRDHNAKPVAKAVFNPLQYGAAPEKWEETVITYTTFNNHPVQLVVEKKTHRVILRVAHAKDEMFAGSDKELEYLKKEVERFQSHRDESVALGSTGKYFCFTSGYPVWGPHTGFYGEEGSFECLYFADGAMISNGLIRARGYEKPAGYYPYNLAVR